jgi:hypothetical protein
MRSGVLETQFTHIVSAEIARKTENELFRLLLPGEKAYVWFVDTTGVTGFTPDIGVAGTELVKRFKEQGGLYMIVVIKLMPVRMMARAISLTSSMHMEIFETRQLALDHLNSVIMPRILHFLL